MTEVKKAVCKVCGETLISYGDMTGPDGEDLWFDGVWDEAVCLSGTEQIRLIASGRLDKVTGWDDRMMELMWQMFIPYHQAVEVVGGG